MCIFLQSALPARTRTANSGFKPLISLHRFRGVLHLVFLPKHSNYSRPPPSTTRPTLHCMKFFYFSKNLFDTQVGLEPTWGDQPRTQHKRATSPGTSCAFIGGQGGTRTHDPRISLVCGIRYHNSTCNATSSP